MSINCAIWLQYQLKCIGESPKGHINQNWPKTVKNNAQSYTIDGRSKKYVCAARSIRLCCEYINMRLALVPS